MAQKIILRDKEQLGKWGKNLLMFTAPALAIFFYQLSKGVEIQDAMPVALFTLYALLFDYFKKLNK